jgi:hypothetical protein
VSKRTSLTLTPADYKAARRNSGSDCLIAVALNRKYGGEWKRHKSRLKPARAQRHARKALRLWRKHKVKAVLFAGLAAGEITAWGVITCAGRARGAVRKMRQRRKKGRKK